MLANKEIEEHYEIVATYLHFGTEDIRLGELKGCQQLENLTWLSCWTDYSSSMSHRMA